MGLAKRLLEHQENQRTAATQIACEAGCLAECEFHERTFVDQHSDPSDAYRLGNSKFTKGELESVFHTRREMTDAIAAAIKSSAAECPSCIRMFKTP